jgi:hypothetical protein
MAQVRALVGEMLDKRRRGPSEEGAADERRIAIH